MALALTEVMDHLQELIHMLRITLWKMKSMMDMMAITLVILSLAIHMVMLAHTIEKRMNS